MSTGQDPPPSDKPKPLTPTDIEKLKKEFLKKRKKERNKFERNIEQGLDWDRILSRCDRTKKDPPKKDN